MYIPFHTEQLQKLSGLWISFGTEQLYVNKGLVFTNKGAPPLQAAEGLPSLATSYLLVWLPTSVYYSQTHPEPVLECKEKVVFVFQIFGFILMTEVKDKVFSASAEPAGKKHML